MNTLDIGCLIDGGDATENSLEVIALAKSLGYTPGEFVGERWQDDDETEPTDEYAEWLGFEAESAESFIGEQDCFPPYTWIGWNNGDFGVWPIYNDDELPRYDDLPEYVYQISDHGNVTLYRATYTEVWGIV